MPIGPNPYDLNVRPPNYSIGEQWKLVDKYDSTFWSGQDVAIYANNIKIQDAVQMNYQVLEPIRPLYHYSSFVADRMIHGQRIIAGEFSIHYKKDGYIFSLVSALSKEENWLTGSRNRELNNPIRTVSTENGLFRYDAATVDAIKNGKYKGKNLSQIVEKIHNNELLDSDAQIYPPIVHNERGMFWTKDGGFDINIVFGTNLRSEQTLKYNGSDHMIADITKNDDKKLNSKVATGTKLIGVELGGYTKTIADDGRSIMETYTFQATNTQPINFEDLI